jgi:hypothetical protein
LVGVVAALMLGSGGALLLGLLVAPGSMEYGYGQLKTSVTGTVNQARESISGDLPSVRLGTSGGVPELDRCDGTFTEMKSYERDGVPPVWAAHNNCSGDAMLPWELGQRVQMAGDDRVFEVVDVRDTPKTWATTEDLLGLGGEFALQTCFYGEDRMKFVGLAVVDE